MRQILLFLFAFLAGACASPERSVYISDAAPSLVAPTRAAMRAWNRGLQQLCPDVRLVSAINRDTADIVVYWSVVAEYPTADGVERAGMVRVNPNEVRPDEYEHLLIIIGHELGHALGVEHSNDRRDLMYSKPWGEGPRTGPTTRDIKRACDVWDGGKIVIGGET